ncbi:hypothetical protein P4G85_10290 [Bacillus cereus]|uniref:Uncharacterized protein n=2 Tax=Bacillus cereus group TaxID=86661 RepID=A0A9W5KRI3_BACCE|nr:MULTISPECIES: hypothetical protein [Bacillus cereus group]MEB8748718.1 hypothetical protein [Bacillus cereus]EEM44328.1 hypothetical protein bthur0005_59370 [Bacillus thuringiensis serovar pakistani str. T13001]EJR64008.1 hypothetical protein IK5_05794 [Bacillus cereus VD154]KIU74538.1 hypothetical protein C797_12246 [Bacillus thuringiensis Sbt003]MEB8759291.1 hypothetical protein [Bacillus cereus]
MSISDAFGGLLTLGYNITVSSQVTKKQTVRNPKAPDTYQYDKYVGVAYQLRSNYTVLPSSRLSEEITNERAVLAQETSRYDESTLYLAVILCSGI